MQCSVFVINTSTQKIITMMMMQMRIFVIGRICYIINQDLGTLMLSFDLIGREHSGNLGINVQYDTEIQ